MSQSGGRGRHVTYRLGTRMAVPSLMQYASVPLSCYTDPALGPTRLLGSGSLLFELRVQRGRRANKTLFASQLNGSFWWCSLTFNSDKFHGTNRFWQCSGHVSVYDNFHLHILIVQLKKNHLGTFTTKTVIWQSLLQCLFWPCLQILSLQHAECRKRTPTSLTDIDGRSWEVTGW